MPSVMSRLLFTSPRKTGSRACKRHRLDSPPVAVPPSPKKPVRLPSEILVDVALFLCRLDLDAIQFSCQRHRAFVQDNTHLVPLRRLAQISFEPDPPRGLVKVCIQPRKPTRSPAGTVRSIEFNGTWDELLAEKGLFQNVVQYSVTRSLKLATPYMQWDVVSDLFGDTPLTIRVSRELAIGDKVQWNFKGMSDFLRPFALINCLECPYFMKWHCMKAFDDFLQWCTENRITQLKVDAYSVKVSDDAVLDFCFGSHGTDSDPRHLKAAFQCRADFLERLCEANRKCSRSGQITIELTAKRIDAPNIGKLAPYRVEGPRRIDRFFDETVFELPEEYGLRIAYADRHPLGQGAASKCRIHVYRSAHSD